MAITFVASARTPTTFPGVSTNTASAAISKPTGTAQNDVMFAFLSGGGISFTTVPSGWTLIDTLATPASPGSSMNSSVYYKVAGASEPTSYTWTADSALTPVCGAILTYRGVDTSQPFNAQANGGDVGATPADPLATPTITATKPSWALYFRVGKTSTVASEGTFTASGATLRQRYSNRGGSTQYYAEVWDSNSQVAAGSVSGLSMDGSLTLTGSIERTVAVSLPTEGTIAQTLPSVTSSFAATVVLPSGPIAATLPSVSANLAGQHDTAGDLNSSLSPVTSSMTGDATGGPLAATLPKVTSTTDGAVNPTGPMDASLPQLVPNVHVETRPLGEQVIRVEKERRGFRITDDDMVSVFVDQLPIIREAVVETTLTAASFAGDGLQSSSNVGTMTSALSPVTSTSSATLEDMMKYAATIGDGSSNSYVVNHAMNTRYVSVTVYDSSTFEEVIPSTIVHTDVNNVTVSFASAPATNEYTVVVLGSYI